MRQLFQVVLNAPPGAYVYAPPCEPIHEASRSPSHHARRAAIDTRALWGRNVSASMRFRDAPSWQTGCGAC